jgi:hypothetical protein
MRVVSLQGEFEPRQTAIALLQMHVPGYILLAFQRSSYTSLMEQPVVPARFSIPIFAGVGLVLFFLNHALILIVMRAAANAGHSPPATLIELTNIAAPGLFLLAVALGLFLTAGSLNPPWVQDHWPLAIAIFYVLHIPMNLLPRPAILGRWGFMVYALLGSLGVVCAVRLLAGRFHLAAILLLADSLISPLTRSRLSVALRAPTTALFSMITFALIGWWFHEAARASERGTKN